MLCVSASQVISVVPSWSYTNKFNFCVVTLTKNVYLNKLNWQSFYFGLFLLRHVKNKLIGALPLIRSMAYLYILC